VTTPELIVAMRDVVWVAYTAAEGAVELADRMAGCARCGHATAVMIPVGQVISRRFTGYESWTNLAGRCLGAVCVYRGRPLRTGATSPGIRPGCGPTPELMRDGIAEVSGADGKVLTSSGD
jgi:hypothetical protein